MKLRVIHAIATTTMLAMLCGAVSAADKATVLLERADAFRATFDAFVLRVRLTNTENGRTADEADFEVSVKGENSLVKFLDVRSKGQSMLMRGDDMWLFLPAVARPVRITPIQRLMGNVSNGDLARLRYSIDYTATIEGTETVDGRICDVLELTARRKAATYQRVRYVLAQADSRPVRAEYFLTSGKLIRRASFSEPREMGGRTILSRTAIEDVERPGTRTTIDFLSLGVRDIPDKVFSLSRTGG